MDSTVRFELKDRQLDVYLKAITDKPHFVFLRWNYRTDEPVRVNVGFHPSQIQKKKNLIC